MRVAAAAVGAMSRFQGIGIIQAPAPVVAPASQVLRPGQYSPDSLCHTPGRALGCCPASFVVTPEPGSLAFPEVLWATQRAFCKFLLRLSHP